jgi:hypothetical protein
LLFFLKSFLSKFFLAKNEELVHGADLYAGYVGDESFVRAVEYENIEGQIFPVQVTKEVLVKTYGKLQGLAIFKDYCWMLVFDAWVGNNDRHFYNWGVINNLDGKVAPRFAPIYDTARGLLWNQSDLELAKWSQESDFGRARLIKYCRNSKPKTGIDGVSSLNHYNFVSRLVALDIPLSKDEIARKLTSELLSSAKTLIDTDFELLLSLNRKRMIQFILEERTQQLLKILA